MEEINVLKEVERLQFNNQKELLTEMSKNTYLDIEKLINGRECERITYDTTSFVDESLDLQMVVLAVSAFGKDWQDMDYLYYVCRKTSVKLSNVEKVVRDMANYYATEVLSLEESNEG